jgi:hypothetical protein
MDTAAATGASYAPARNRRISGYSLGLRFGFAGGGDTLASAQLSDGSSRSVSGGGGGAVAADLKLTPFWLADTVGFGAGGEIGWKGQEISADNGSVSLDRFPLVVTAHVILRATDYAYFMLSGGVEKDLAISFTGSGVGALNGDVTFKSSIGGAGALAFYYALTPHFTLDAAVRFARLHYDVAGPGGTGRVDASNGGFSMGAQYQF